MKNLLLAIFILFTHSVFSQTLLNFNHWGGTSDFSALYTNDMAVDKQNNVYISGQFYNDVIINGPVLSSTPGSSGDAVIYKVYPGGSVPWTLRTIGGASIDAMGIDDSANIYFSGMFTRDLTMDSIILHDPATTGRAIMLGKADSAGNLKWLQYYHIRSGQLKDIVISPDGAITITGSFMDSLFLPVLLNSVNATNLDVFIAHFDRNGNYQWAKKGEGSGSQSDVGRALAVDTAGNIFCLGDFYTSVNFNGYTLTAGNNAYAGYCMKLSPSGNVLYGQSFYSTTNLAPQDIAVDHAGSAYITGCGQALHAGTVTTPQQSVYYILKYKAAGNPAWAQSIYSNYGPAAGGYHTRLACNNGGFVYYGSIGNKNWINGNDTINAIDGRPDIIYLAYDSTGNVLETYHIGKQESDVAGNVAFAPNGDIVLTGSVNDSLQSYPIGFGLNSLAPLYYTNLPGGNIFLARLNSIVATDEIASADNDYKIYPNPAFDHITLTASHNRTVSYTITDITGRKITGNNFQNDIQLDVSTFKSGMYLILLNDNYGKNSVLKLIRN